MEGVGMRRVLGVLAAVVVLGAGCGDGEDRPGDASASGSVSGAVSGAAAAGAPGSASGAHEEEEDHESSEPAFAEDEADTVVHATLSEFKIETDVQGATGPKIYFEAVNEGEIQHELIVKDADDEELGEVHIEEPGGEAALAVELEPGTYTLLCEIEEGDQTHADLGMTSTFTVE